jgi:hypothetical protein
VNAERDEADSPRNRFPWLERAAAVVLLLVLVCLGWMVAVAYQPSWLRFFSQEVEVIVTCSLLAAAIGLVSLVALLHTR